MTKILTKIELLKKYDNEYFNGVQTITDTEYDILKEQAKLEFPNDPYFKTIGAEVKSEKVLLPFILGSLDKVWPENVSNWTKNKEGIVVSYKLDGVSFMSTWINGKVTFASTRGDGTEGQDITEKMRKILPNIPVKDRVSLRGELLLFGDDHLKLGYKNRRNGVNGALAHHVEMLHPMFYELLEIDDYDKALSYEDERLQLIEQLGLDVVPYTLIENVDVETLTEILIETKTKNYDCDGLVLTINDSEREDEMLPKNKVAFKVNMDAVKATVTKVEWNLGRTGKVTPTVHIKPIEVDGVTISKTTGFNRDFIANQRIGAGSVIGIVRSGGVIPYITETFTPVEPNIPVMCPCCNSILEESGVELICTNENCYDSTVRQIAHFFKTMGTEYITETTIRNLGVNSIEEMYELDELDIANIEGFGIKKAEQIYNEIQKTLTITPDKLLAAFGIAGIGKTLSTPILEKYEFEELFSIDAIEDVDGVGEILSNNLVENINTFRGLYLFLKEKGLKFIMKEKTNITNKIFTLTGKMPMKRDVITKMITTKGGMVKGISKTTDYLVTDDPFSGSIKNKKAQEYGTQIIDFDQLMEIIGE